MRELQPQISTTKQELNSKIALAKQTLAKHSCDIDSLRKDIKNHQIILSILEKNISYLQSEAKIVSLNEWSKLYYSRQSIKEYIASLKNKLSYHESIATSWQTSLDRLQSKPPAIIILLDSFRCVNLTK